MTITRVGSTGKYAEGWEMAFGKKRPSVAASDKKKPSKKPAASRRKKKK